MKLSRWLVFAGLALLVGCGAGDPPRVEGGPDLTEFWRATL